MTSLSIRYQFHGKMHCTDGWKLMMRIAKISNIKNNIKLLLYNKRNIVLESHKAKNKGKVQKTIKDG